MDDSLSSSSSSSSPTAAAGSATASSSTSFINYNGNKKGEFAFPKPLKDNQFSYLDTNKKTKDLSKQLEFLRKVADNLKEDDWCYPSLNKYLGLQ